MNEVVVQGQILERGWKMRENERGEQDERTQTEGAKAEGSPPLLARWQADLAECPSMKGVECGLGV